MRFSLAVALFLGLFLAPPVPADPPTETRYGVTLDTKAFPQSTAKEALTSIIKAIEDKRFDYLVAQLADPAYIDDRVQRLFAGKVEPQVEETRLKMDAATLKLFQHFLKDGEWTVDKSKDECVRLKDVKDRCIYFHRVGERWYLENRYKPAD